MASRRGARTQIERFFKAFELPALYVKAWAFACIAVIVGFAATMVAAPDLADVMPALHFPTREDARVTEDVLKTDWRRFLSQQQYDMLAFDWRGCFSRGRFLHRRIGNISFQLNRGYSIATLALPPEMLWYDAAYNEDPGCVNYISFGGALPGLRVKPNVDPYSTESRILLDAIDRETDRRLTDARFIWSLKVLIAWVSFALALYLLGMLAHLLMNKGKRAEAEAASRATPRRTTTAASTRGAGASRGEQAARARTLGDIADAGRGPESDDKAGDRDRPAGRPDPGLSPIPSMFRPETPRGKSDKDTKR